MRFGKKGKLSPRYIGPYKITRRFGQVVYELELPQELSLVHPVFHVSMLQKCIGDPSLSLPKIPSGRTGTRSREGPGEPVQIPVLSLTCHQKFGQHFVAYRRF